MHIYISSDHGGFKLKEYIKTYLEKQGHTLTDLGPTTYSPTDDYPEYVIPLIRHIQTSYLKTKGNLNKDNKEIRGILICRNGVGVSMLANKFKYIRATLSWNTKHAQSSRTDDNTNVLSLPADYVATEEALKIVQIWLKTPFSKAPRHKRRLNKVEHFGDMA